MKSASAIRPQIDGTGNAGPSRDYHDYVFKDGRLVGDFEGMYVHSADIPWHQDRTAFDTISEIDIAILKRCRPSRIADIGCGLGYFSARMASELHGLGGSRPAVTGYDIAPTAIAAARDLHPGLEFDVLDLLADAPLPSAAGSFDLVVMRGVIWYVVHDLDCALARFAALGAPGASVLVTLSFPPSRRFVGQEILPDAEALRARLATIMTISHWCVEEDENSGMVPLCHAFGTLLSGAAA